MVGSTLEVCSFGLNFVSARTNKRHHHHVCPFEQVFLLSSIDMYNNDVGKKSAQKIMKQTGDLKAATLYFAS